VVVDALGEVFGDALNCGREIRIGFGAHHLHAALACVCPASYQAVARSCLANLGPCGFSARIGSRQFNEPRPRR
jgi:hypothetical protein